MPVGIRSILTPFAIYAVLSAGCATSYSPREPGRISFVMKSGNEVLEKDGKKYSIGGFSGDLTEAVSGNPAAEEHARTYVRRQRIATGLALGFAGGFLVGNVLVGLAMAEPTSGSRGDQTRPNERSHFGDRRAIGYTGLGLLTGAVACLIGALILGAPHGHLYDAINVYNDGLTKNDVKPSESEP